MALEVDLSADKLIEDFSHFDDWREKYQYIIELGDEIDGFPDDERIDENLVQGCQSRVWLIAHARPEQDPPVIDFQADSDSQIVRGLIVILMVLMSGKTAAEIQHADVEGVFEQLDLDRNLSRSRANGLYSMVKRIRELATR